MFLLMKILPPLPNNIILLLLGFYTLAHTLMAIQCMFHALVLFLSLLLYYYEQNECIFLGFTF